MRVPGRKLAVQSFRWARSRLRGGVVVLGYHRLRRSPAEDPFDLAIPHDDFAAQIGAMARLAQVMRLGEAVEALSTRRLPPRGVVITFDDGYADTVAEVLPVLEQHRIPATVFITTGSPGGLFWWDELTQMLLESRSLPGRLTLAIRGRRCTWSLAADATVDRAHRREVLHSVAAALRPLAPAERKAVLSEVRAWCGWEQRHQTTHRALTSAEIRRLAASTFIDIGAHTVSHPALTSLSRDELTAEIAQSRATLTELTGRPVASFSYPHGAYGASTIAAVRAAGFTVACCSTPDLLGYHSNIYAVPRLWARPGDGASFERWLQRWLAG